MAGRARRQKSRNRIVCPRWHSPPFQRTVKRGQGEKAEFRLLLPGGEVRHIESVGNVIHDARGEPDRVVVVSRDVTERRETVEFLRICYQVSTRRAVQTLNAPRATLYYRSRKAEQAPLRHRIKEIAAVRVRALDQGGPCGVIPGPRTWKNRNAFVSTSSKQPPLA